MTTKAIRLQGKVHGEPGPAQRRRHKMRRHINGEAVKLYEENGGEEGGGLEKTTVEDIASRSDIAVRTFFTYFQSKLDVIYIDMPALIDDHLELTERFIDTVSPAEASIGAGLVQLTEGQNLAEDKKRMIRAYTSKYFAERRNQFRSEWSERLATLIATRLPDTKNRILLAQMIATTTIELKETTAKLWATGGGERDVLDVYQEVISAGKSVWAFNIPDRPDPQFDRQQKK